MSGRLLAALAISVVLAAPGMVAQAADFPGRVFDAVSTDGIQNVQVKLTPPRRSKAPIRIATTARDGAFEFSGLIRGRYLVEVSQGVTLVYRAEVDTSKVDRLDIALRRK